MSAIGIALVIGIIIFVVLVSIKKKPEIVAKVEQKVEDISDEVESKVDRIKSVLKETTTMDKKLWVDVIPPKDAFLEDMNGRSYQLYIQTYNEFPKPRVQSTVTGVGVTSDLSGIRVNDGSGITNPAPEIYPSGSIEANPTVKREKVALKEFLLSNPKTPEELKFNDLMAEGRVQEAYKYAFRYYFRGEGRRPTSKGMGGSGGEFFQKIVALYGDPGYKHLVAQFN